MISRPTTRIAATLVAVSGTAVLLAACGSSKTGAGSAPAPAASAAQAGGYGPAATGPHNAADVSFATDMIPHHAQAVEMATMALTQASNAQVKTLAAAIKGAQDPEVKTMSGWLAGWGEKVPAADGSMSAMHHMGGAGGDGMMSPEEMQQLGAATGATFDRLWVSLMTKHHQGAIAMAQRELGAGQNTDSTTLAGTIIKEQTGEVATLTSLAATLG